MRWHHRRLCHFELTSCRAVPAETIALRQPESDRAQVFALAGERILECAAAGISAARQRGLDHLDVKNGAGRHLEPGGLLQTGPTPSATPCCRSDNLPCRSTPVGARTRARDINVADDKPSFPCAQQQAPSGWPTRQSTMHIVALLRDCSPIAANPGVLGVHRPAAELSFTLNYGATLALPACMPGQTDAPSTRACRCKSAVSKAERLRGSGPTLLRHHASTCISAADSAMVGFCGSRGKGPEQAMQYLSEPSVLSVL